MPEETKPTTPDAGKPNENAEPKPSAAADTAPATGSTEGAPDIWAQIAALDPDELVKRHPKMAGKVGEIADRLSQKRRKEWEAQAEQTRQAEERRRLRDEDPEKFAELERKSEQERTRQSAMEAEVYSGLLEFFEKLPDAGKQKLSGKSYGRWAEGIREYVGDLIDATVDGRVAEALDKERAKWEKEARPAIRKEVLAELNGGAPAPDAGSGSPATPRRFTRDQIAKMSTADYAKYRDQILASLK